MPTLLRRPALVATPLLALLGLLGLLASLLLVPAPAGAAPASSTLTSSVLAGSALQRAVAEPEVGECHRLDLTAQAALADGTKPVSCERNHTSRTFSVIDVPKGTKMSDLEALSELVDQKCTPAWNRTVGGSTAKRLLAIYSYIWFAPTEAQIEDGARFLRCDLIIVGNKRAVSLPDARQPQLGKGSPSTVEARCFTGKRSGYRALSCSQRHEFRAAGTFKLKGKKYPSSARLQRIANRRCTTIAGPQWLAIPPSPESFANGFKFVICAAANKR